MPRWKGIVGEGFTPAAFDAYVRQLAFGAWRPSFVVLHNTEVPRFSDWHRVPGKRRMEGLARYYRDDQGWSAGPHLFVADDLIWVFTPLTTSGVHSPSWNGISWGVEMVGDYRAELLDRRVRDNTVHALATLHSVLGLDPQKLRLHKEDPGTTHRGCPGPRVDKADIVRRVQAQMGGRFAGEHLDARAAALPEPTAGDAARALRPDGVSAAPGSPESAGALADAALAGVRRDCAVQPYTRIDPLPEFTLTREVVAYASPDSTFAVTRRLLQAAQTSILIGIYDFSAGQVKELLLQALRRGVSVTLMLDLDRNSREDEVFRELQEGGALCVAAPSCSHPRPGARTFASAHEKVVVVDGEWTLVQSGNFSGNGIPANPDGEAGSAFVPGNREMGVAVRSPEVACFFTDLLQGDIRRAEGEDDPTPLLMDDSAHPAPLFLAAPGRPPRLFPSRTLTPGDGGVRARAVLTPDNYLEVVGPLLRGARRSVWIEEQYIKARQPATRELLAILRQRLDEVPGFEVRIVLGRIFDRGDLADLEALERDFGLRPGDQVRLINLDHFVHCHNKLVIVDGERVLLGSQNWSDFALKRNREASLLVDWRELAEYFGEIFRDDWNNGSTTPPELEEARFLGAEAVGTRSLFPLDAADFVQV